jgi:hypothetical protein
LIGVGVMVAVLANVGTGVVVIEGTLVGDNVLSCVGVAV